MGKRKVLSVNEKKECHTYRDQFTIVSQQNIANNFSYFGTYAPVDVVLAIYSRKRITEKTIQC
jgi:hypothetical protein